MVLKDKTALITGGSRGIGKAVATAFLREGARVMLASRSVEELKGAQAEFEKTYGKGRVLTFLADVSKEADVKKLVSETAKAFGKIDILVNAAGIYGPIGPSEQVDFEKWKNTFEVNVFGTFKVLQEVLPYMMKAKKGKVVNFSGGGDGPFPRFSAYNSSKVAVVRLSETLAAEMRGYAIDINAIAPGPVNTAFLDEALAAGEAAVGKERYQALLKQKADGGVPPEKTAELCVFLASAASDGLSGKFLSVVWDDWKKWDKKEIEKIMAGERFALRRRKE